MTKKKNRNQKPELKVKDLPAKTDPQGGGYNLTNAWPSKVSVGSVQSTTDTTTVKK